MSVKEALTRRKAQFFDRAKILIALGVIITILVLRDVNDPFVTLSEAFANFVATFWGLLMVTLFGLEVLRQIHYLISERSTRYHLFWTKAVFGRTERVVQRTFRPWTRFRVRRYITTAIFVFFLMYVVDFLSESVDSPLEAFTNFPALLLNLIKNPEFIRLLFFMFIFVGQFALMFWFLSRGGTNVVTPDEIKTRFDDVWGQDHVLELVRENIAFLEKPDEIEAKGGYIPGGILLWGPPGTGKTLIAEAIAGETGRPYMFVDPGAFQAMFMGVGILKVKSVFKKLRKLSLRHGGVVVFFDEADALGNRGAGVGGAGQFQSTGMPAHLACNGVHFMSAAGQREVVGQWLQTLPEMADDPGASGSRVNRMMMGGGGGGGGGMGTLQALLTEISGLTKPRGIGNRLRKLLGMRAKPPPQYRILIMMATNMPNALDQALLRPGRIDRIYKVGYPSKEGRKRTLEGYLAKVQNDLTEDEVERLAVTTAYYSGAKIKDLVNEALILAIRVDREVVTFTDMWKARALKEMGPPEDAEYIVRERYAVAIHEASHAVAAHLLSTRRSIDMVTIERRGNVGGFVRSLDVEDRFTSWRTELEADIKVSLASLAGERLFFEADNSSGVTGDLQNATQLASYMEGVYGMGDQLMSFAGLSGGMFGIGDPAEKVINSRAKKVEGRLKKMYDGVYQLLDEYKEKVLALAEVLVAERTISGDRVSEVMGSEPGVASTHKPTGFSAFDPEISPLVVERSALPLPTASPGSASPGDSPASDDDARSPNGEDATATPAVQASSPNGESGDEESGKEPVGKDGAVGPRAPQGETP